MAITSSYDLQRVLTVNGRRVLSPTETVSGVTLLQPSFTIAASTTFSLPSSSFTYTKLAGFFLYSADKDVTVNFNTTGAAVAYALTAGIPRDWASTGHGSNPLGSDCTSISVVNATTSTSDVYVFVEVTS